MSKKKKKKKRSGTVTVEQHINKPAAFETKRHSEKSPASEKELHAKKLKKICFITALVTMALILILAVTAIVSTLIRGSKPKIDDYLHSSSAAVIDGYELDGAMMCVIFYDNYHEFAPYMNINTSLSLKKQYTDDSERIFDLFVRISKGDAQRLLCEAKGASDMGLTLSYTEKKALRARAYNTDLTVYPSAITEEDIYKTLELRALAAKYEAATKPTLKPELSEIEAYCAQNSNVYDLIDMMAFSIYYADDTDGAAAFTKDEAAAHAKVLSEAADRESFENAVRAIIKEGSPDITEEEMSEYTNGLALTGVSYKSGDDISEWAFSAKPGQSHTAVDEEARTYTVYMLSKEPYHNESPTRSYRLILLSDTDFKSHSDTKKKASELLDAYNNSNKSPESFSASAMEYSTDSMSYLNCGLYENIKSGVMLTELDDWVFDSARVKSDAAVIEISGGCAVVIYEGDGLPSWQAQVIDDMLYERYNEHCDALADATPVLFDETVLDSIPA